MTHYSNIPRNVLGLGMICLSFLVSKIDLTDGCFGYRSPLPNNGTPKPDSFDTLSGAAFGYGGQTDNSFGVTKLETAAKIAAVTGVAALAGLVAWGLARYKPPADNVSNEHNVESMELVGDAPSS